MRASLDAFGQIKAALKPVITPTVVLAGYEAQPTTGKYVVVSVISAPPVDTMCGEAYALVRVQLDAWSYDVSPVSAALLAETCRDTLTAQGWVRVPSGRPPQGWEGQPDGQGRRWFSASADYRIF